eukprot:794727-Alexandrium_andersonii.AAC.1
MAMEGRSSKRFQSILRVVINRLRAMAARGSAEGPGATAKTTAEAAMDACWHCRARPKHSEGPDGGGGAFNPQKPLRESFTFNAPRLG